MDKTLEEQLGTVFCEVLESLAFLFGEVVNKQDVENEQSSSVRVSMQYKGDHKGYLSLMIPASMCDMIAVNVLGLDDEEDFARERSEDTLKEVLNVVCGQMLTTVYGNTPVFDLTVPAVDKPENDAWKDMRDSRDSLAFMVEDEPVLVQFREME